MADGLFVRGRRRRSLRSCSIACRRWRTCCRTARGWSWRRRSGRRTGRARPSRRARPWPRRSAGRGPTSFTRCPRRSVSTSRSTYRSSRRGSTLDSPTGGAPRGTPPSSRPAWPICPRATTACSSPRAVTVRWNASGSSWAPRSRSMPSRRRSRTASSRRPRRWPSPPRRTCSAAAGTRATRRGSRAGAPTRSPTELEPGDLAVHQVHGVGRYVGIMRRAIAGAERDYLLLEYAPGRPAVRARGPGRHRREVRRRRGAAPAPPGRLATG